MNAPERDTAMIPAGDGETDSMFPRPEISPYQTPSPRPSPRGPVQHVAQARVDWPGFPSSLPHLPMYESSYALHTAGVVLGRLTAGRAYKASPMLSIQHTALGDDGR
jgi:hypothetical protein